MDTILLLEVEELVFVTESSVPKVRVPSTISYSLFDNLVITIGWISKFGFTCQLVGGTIK